MCVCVSNNSDVGYFISKVPTSCQYESFGLMRLFFLLWSWHLTHNSSRTEKITYLVLHAAGHFVLYCARHHNLCNCISMFHAYRNQIGCSGNTGDVYLASPRFEIPCVTVEFSVPQRISSRQTSGQTSITP
jgi:hypothetical protein